ncbi:hypothetical protein LSAT2_010081 [Lamellibrachia satsuma]|nr:hypothetical protein LSAT2_010081 [Lamellibrachia satsuma]
MVEMKIRPVDFVRERDVCLKDPCKNGGWCTIIRHGFFRCYCELGFVGDQCETDVDECHSSPCENGGNCTDGPGGFSCQCPLTFSGTNCEEDACNCPMLDRPTPCRVDLESGRCVALTKPGQPVDRILRVLTIILCIMAFVLVVILIILIITYKAKSPSRVHPVVDMRRK